MVSRTLSWSDDKQREQWLKRLLPALLVTVIYFVFVSGTLSKAHDKAEQAYKALQLKGVDESALFDLNQRKQKLAGELATLRQRNQKEVELLSGKLGVVTQSEHVNHSIDQLVQLMQQAGVSPVEDRSLGLRKPADLPRSLADLSSALHDLLPNSDGVRLHQFEVIGSYTQVYDWLRFWAASEVRAVPVSVVMRNIDDPHNRYVGKKKWTVECWL